MALNSYSVVWQSGDAHTDLSDGQTMPTCTHSPLLLRSLLFCRYRHMSVDKYSS